MKVVIVGGVSGGATAAARLRRLDEQAEIIIIERTHFVSYANCGLPYYIGGTITDRNKLTLQTPESFHNRFNIEVRVDQEVTKICLLYTSSYNEQPRFSASSRKKAIRRLPKLRFGVLMIRVKERSSWYATMRKYERASLISFLPKKGTPL